MKMSRQKNKQIQMMEDNYQFQQENNYMQQSIILNNPNLNSSIVQSSYFLQEQLSENFTKQNSIFGQVSSNFVLRSHFKQKKKKDTIVIVCWPPEQELYKYSRIKDPKSRSKAPYIIKITDQYEKAHPQLKTYYWGIVAKNKMKLTIRCYSKRNSTTKLCHWRLIYMYSKESKLFQLKFYNNKHQHHCRKDIFQKKKQQIKYADLKLAAQDQNQFYKMIVKINKLDRSSKSTKKRRLEQVISSQNQNLQQILIKQIEHFKQFDYKAYLHNEQQKMEGQTKTQQKQDVILFINPLMKYLYKNYNRVIFIQRQKFFQREQNQKYSIINFYGVSFNASNVCFGITIIKNQNKSKLQIMIKMFFYIHKKYGKTIIISHLEKQIIQIVKNIIEENKQNTQINLVQTAICGQYPNFGEMFVTKDNIFQTQQLILNRITQKFKKNYLKYQQKTYLKTFMRNFPEYLVEKNSNKSYDRYQGTFVGFSFIAGRKNCVWQQKAKRTQQINSLIMKQIFTRIQERFRNVNMNYFKKDMSTLQIEKYFNNIQSLQKLRYTLSKKPFQKLCQNMTQSLTLTINTEHPEFFYLVSNRIYSFIVRKTFEKQPPLACQCKYFQKSGIPCPHILKVAIVNEINLVLCIDIYWITNFAVIGLDQNTRNQTPKRGRPKYIDKCKLKFQ